MINFCDFLKKQIREDPKFVKMWDDDELRREIVLLILKQRNILKMTQSDLAKKAKTSLSAIVKLENGNSNPSLAFILRITKALNVKIKVSVAHNIKFYLEGEKWCQIKNICSQKH